MRRGRTANRIFDFWLGIPLLNLLATLPRGRRTFPSEPRKIGVVCSPALGDTLLFSSVLQDLRGHFDRFPNPVEIVHLCMRPNLAAAEIIPGAHRRLLVSLTSPLATIRAIRAERFDALLDFTSWQRLTAFYTLTSAAGFTAGFCTPGQHRARAYDLAVPHRADRHEVDNFRAILRALGIEAGAPPQVILSEATALPEPFATTRDLIIFHLWASGQRNWLREWPGERWIALAQQLARPRTLFVITGAPADLPRTEPFVARLRSAGLAAEAFVGSDGFRGLARLLRRARVVVSVNTGVMHLAAIVGAPTVAINGPNRNGRWGPIGPRALGLEAPGADCGYLHLGFNFDGEATDCMERTSVDAVLAAVELVTQLTPRPAGVA
jgi:ADP-heptose:LPS heptosyltransferase